MLSIFSPRITQSCPSTAVRLTITEANHSVKCRYSNSLTWSNIVWSGCWLSLSCGDVGPTYKIHSLIPTYFTSLKPPSTPLMSCNLTPPQHPLPHNKGTKWSSIATFIHILRHVHVHQFSVWTVLHSICLISESGNMLSTNITVKNHLHRYLYLCMNAHITVLYVHKAKVYRVYLDT